MPLGSNPPRLLGPQKRHRNSLNAGLFFLRLPLRSGYCAKYARSYGVVPCQPTRHRSFLRPGRCLFGQNQHASYGRCTTRYQGSLVSSGNVVHSCRPPSHIAPIKEGRPYANLQASYASRAILDVSRNLGRLRIWELD